MRNLLLRNYIPVICLSLSLLASVLSAQPADSLQGIFDLLQSDKERQITLRTNMDSIFHLKKTVNYTEGLLICKFSKKEILELPVRIRSRGKFRRMKCNFPPLKLKFRKDDLEVHHLNHFNELKLVTHCIDEKNVSRDLILKEHLVYKLYNLLTPNSFRTQLVQVNYECTGSGQHSAKRWGILIEDSEDLGRRIGGHVYERMGIPSDSLHANQEKIASVFNFMISNVDWSYELARNMEFLRMPDGMVIPVPYDFDFSGVVMAPYSRPAAHLGQKNMRYRVFLGNSKSVEELKNVLAYFRSKQTAIYELIDHFNDLDDASKADIRLYVESFFTLLDSDEATLRNAFFPPKPEMQVKKE